MVVFIPGSTQFASPIQALVRLAQAAARPNFELQFHIAQNTALDRLNEQVKAFQDADFGEAKTALLRVKSARLERELAAAKDFEAVITTNRLLVKQGLDELETLRALADPASEAEFEAQRSQLLDTLDRLRTAVTSSLAAPDGLAEAKTDGLARIEAIVTNGFATAADIQAAQDAIDEVSAQFTTALSIVDINKSIATNTAASKSRVLDQLKLEIDDITIAERKEQIDRIQALEEKTARVLTSLSLAFEGSQSLADYVAENTVLQKEIPPGSVLNLFA